MNIQNIKEKLGYIDIPIQKISPQHDDDVCYIDGFPFQPMSYKSLKEKKIADYKICKCLTKRQYLKDCNITNFNIEYNEGNKTKR